LDGTAHLFGNYKLDMKGIFGSLLSVKRLYFSPVISEYVWPNMSLARHLWASRLDALKAASMIPDKCRTRPV
jgi:hypothetical protein